VLHRRPESRIGQEEPKVVETCPLLACASMQAKANEFDERVGKGEPKDRECWRQQQVRCSRVSATRRTPVGRRPNPWANPA
jgi:hypothetical protein